MFKTVLILEIFLGQDNFGWINCSILSFEVEADTSFMSELRFKPMAARSYISGLISYKERFQIDNKFYFLYLNNNYFTIRNF